MNKRRSPYYRLPWETKNPVPSRMACFLLGFLTMFALIVITDLLTK
jgi:hypothetical protein